MEYFVDILEPDKDLNKAVDQLGHTISELYRRAWDDDKREQYNGKPFSLNVGVFVDMWVNGILKLFVAYDKSDGNKPVGFLVGMSFRPLPYEARVFQIEDWYVLPEHKDKVEQYMFDHVTQAIRYMSCDEIWSAGDTKGDAPTLKGNWKLANCFKRYRYIKS